MYRDIFISVCSVGMYSFILSVPGIGNMCGSDGCEITYHILALMIMITLIITKFTVKLLAS